MKKTLLLKTMILVAILLVSTLPLWANHVVVENVSITDQNAASDYTHIKFDISWENSWRVSAGPSNWDAAWVFAKWKLHSGTDWAHCTLSSTDGDHTAPSGSTIDAASDGTGIFIYRSSDGSGSNNWDNVKLRWNYGTDGVADDATVDVKVFAIEMVYIPEGNFYLGDGSSSGTFRQTGSNTPVQITTTPVVVKCENTDFDDAQLEGDGILVDGDDGIDKDGTGPVDNPYYPTGYKAFYCMKYEISQGQYADFLSMLTDAQDDNRYPGQNGKWRHTISGSYGSYSASVPDRACNNLTWADGAAYSDWAGLRPMTELEFEKACRGSNSAVAGEYAWGNTNIASSAYTLNNDGQYDESIATNYATDPTGNASYNTTDGDINGPLRCGIFATSTSTRAESGATYYGVMEMSGNLWERAVTLGNADGRGFTGAHGDGSLSNSGYANVNAWPNSSASGSGFRGGSFIFNAARSQVSYRVHAALAVPTEDFMFGFRCARTQ